MLNTRRLFSLLFLLSLFIAQKGYAQDDTAPRDSVPAQEEALELEDVLTVEDVPDLLQTEIEEVSHSAEPIDSASIMQQMLDEADLLRYERMQRAQAAADSLQAAEDKVIANMVAKEFKPDPRKALLYSIVPGLGQIYNRKYWKLPIIYSGYIGCFYSITWNHNSWKDYSEAYMELAELPDDRKNEAKKWLAFVSPKITSIDQIGVSVVENHLKSNKDSSRRFRDLSIIITAALYFLTFIDAYVDAQLYDFDISPDLSMKVRPTIIERDRATAHSFGLQCSINF